MTFSVIVPVYNNMLLLDRCINSVLNQDYDDFELIIVDDGSTDRVEEQVEKYSDTRIVFYQKENGGVSSARNLGIQLSKGDYICFLDSDDEYYPNHLSTLKNLINRYVDAGIYATSHRVSMMDGSLRDSSRFLLPLLDGDTDCETRDGYKYVLSAKSDIIHTNSMCIRRSCIDTLELFPLGENTGEDLYVWYKMMGYYKFVITSVITTFRHREVSTLSRSIRFKKDPAYLKSLRSVVNDCGIVPEDVRKHAEALIYRYLVSEANFELLSGNKRKALSILKRIHINKYNIIKIMRACICILVPTKMLQYIYLKKDNSFYA